MAKLLLSLHVLAGIIFVGPVTVAVSLFPRYARLAVDLRQRATALPALKLLRRVSAVYALLGLSVPVFGIGVALQLGVLRDTWLVVSTALTLIAAAILALLILPVQQGILAVLEDPDSPLAGDQHGNLDDQVMATWRATTVRLAGLAGVFALLWAIVVVLMILRPGSTTNV